MAKNNFLAEATFKVLSVAKNCFRPESAPLKLLKKSSYLDEGYLLNW